jgi:hypothetical protein
MGKQCVDGFGKGPIRTCHKSDISSSPPRVADTTAATGTGGKALSRSKRRRRSPPQARRISPLPSPPHPQSPSSANWTEHGKKRVMTRYPTLRPPRYATVPPRLFFFLNSLSRRFQNRKAVPNAARAFSTPSFSRYSSFFFLRKRCFDATWTHLPQGFNANLNLNSVPRKLNLPQLYQ